MDNTIFVWPEKPTCHGVVSPVFTYSVVWRPECPDGAMHPSTIDAPHGYPFRTCSYCGSIHPEDLAKYLEAGVAKLGGSDWKYGWPHKFYVEGIPNPKAGQMVKVSEMSCSDRSRAAEEMKTGDQLIEEYEVTQTFRNGVKVTERTGPTIYRVLHYGPAPATTHAKWYNDHLLDLEPAAFEKISQLLMTHANIRFALVDGKLKYMAPRH